MFDRIRLFGNLARSWSSRSVDVPFILAMLFALFSCFDRTRAQDAGASSRTTHQLVVLYDFAEADGDWIRDRSGFGAPLDLKIANPDAVRRRGSVLELKNATKAKIQSVRPATKIRAAIQRTQEITLEAWLTPANKKQNGPARILTISRDSSNRNVTLGQDADRFDVRLRTTRNTANGLPSVSSSKDSVTTRLTHLVYTRNRQGQISIYVDGEPIANGNANGDFSNWDAGYHLILGDEASGGRPWQGSLHLVAIYARGLNRNEVQANYRAGADAEIQIASVEQEDFFASKIAPLLADHCLECHDAVNQEGGLDLSHKLAAMRGGDSGKVLVAGQPNHSSLLQSVISDEMPLDREPLSSEEKELIAEWIRSGADWTMEFVDPVLFAHGGGPEQHFVRRLTTDEYIATVNTTLDVDIDKEARDLLPRDFRADGFANTAYNLHVDLKHVEAYRQLAETIASRTDIDALIQRFAKNKRFTDKDVGQFINRFGEWVLRGPMTEAEVIAYRGISTGVASAGGDFNEAASLILEAMLQSPRFLYRIENQNGDGSRWPVSQFELASRLSYTLWGSSPDQRLFQAARKGELADPRVLEEHVDRMLADSRANERGLQFLSQWLNLDGLQNLNPNRERFPDWNPQLAQDMKAETLAFFRHVALEQNRPLHELLTAQVTFASPRLAKHYRLATESIDSGEGDRLSKFDLREDPARGGLLTQGAVLTVGGDDASMVTRGLFVLHDLLRGVVKDPPPCVDTTPIASEPGRTQRMVATARIQNEACGGCHAKFEPLAFGLERYDGLGTYQTEDEHGNALREDGEVIIPGSATAVPFTSSHELMQILASSDRVRESLTWKVVQFALGRPIVAADAPILAKIHEDAQASGGSYRALMKAIVHSDLLQYKMTLVDN